MNRARALFTLLCLAAAGCGEKGTLPDLGPLPDLGFPADAEPAADAEPEVDAEPAPDADEPTDLGPPPDLGFDDAGQPIFPDAAEPTDTGPSPDAAEPADTGPRPDAGLSSTCATPPHPDMSFFVTDAGNLSGNFGGLSGADARCASAALAAGIGGRTWRAYLSAGNDAVHGRVDARDRIGDGPFVNYAGTSIGTSAAFHGSGVPSTAILTECGRRVIFDAEDREGDPGAHDIFTGSNEQGELVGLIDPNSGLPNGPPATCADWTSASASDRAMVGHSDWNTDSWNSSHYTQGCSEATLRPTGANGRIYCFAID